MKRNQFIKSCVGLAFWGTVANSLGGSDVYFDEGIFNKGYGHIFTYSSDPKTSIHVRMKDRYIKENRVDFVEAGIYRHIRNQEMFEKTDLRIIAIGIPSHIITQAKRYFAYQFRVTETGLNVKGHRVYQIEKLS